MKITWDSKAKAVYIYLDESEAKVSNSTKVSDFVTIDFAFVDRLIGIEVLNVEKKPVVQEV